MQENCERRAVRLPAVDTGGAGFYSSYVLSTYTPVAACCCMCSPPCG